jgi:hypothetical protein
MSTQEALAQGLQTGVMTGMAYKPQQPAPTEAGAPPDVASGTGVDMSGARAPTAPQADFTSTFQPGAQGAMAAPPGMRYDVMSGQYVPSAMPTAAATSMPTAAATPGADSTMFGRMGDFMKSLAPGGEKPTFEAFKNAFLVNPNAETKIGRYVPGVATALAVSGLAGGFKAGEAEENPLFDREYTGLDYIRDNPEKFQGGLTPTVLTPYNPVVETPSYGLQSQPGTTAQGPMYQAPTTGPTMPVSPTPTYYTPSGSPTNMPGGIPQPYNVSGMYGIPLIYGNNQPTPARAPGYAKGGAVDSALKRAAQDPYQVARTEGLLYSGPQAAQAAGQAIQQLSQPNNQGIMAAQGLRNGGQPKHFPRKTGPINGPGTGTSDSIPAMLSDGEFVFTARAVRNAGGGSRRKGARRMYKLMKMLEGGKVEGK